MLASTPGILWTKNLVVFPRRAFLSWPLTFESRGRLWTSSLVDSPHRASQSSLMLQGNASSVVRTHLWGVDGAYIVPWDCSPLKAVESLCYVVGSTTSGVEWITTSLCHCQKSIFLVLLQRKYAPALLRCFKFKLQEMLSSFHEKPRLTATLEMAANQECLILHEMASPESTLQEPCLEFRSMSADHFTRSGLETVYFMQQSRCVQLSSVTPDDWQVISNDLEVHSRIIPILSNKLL